MDILLVMTYTALCIAIFKIFKIPLTKWTVPMAVLGGIFLIGALLVAMNYSHPYSAKGREYFSTTPISPTVKGRVIDVVVQPNELVKQGDELFRLDPEPFQDRVEELSARLDVAVKNYHRSQDMVRKGLGKQINLDETFAKVESLKETLNN